MSSTDPIVKMAQNHLPVDVMPLLQFGLKFSGLVATTPADRIERAVAEEVEDLNRRAREALSTLQAHGHDGPRVREALDLLESDPGIPRKLLEEYVARTRAEAGPDVVLDEVDVWLGKHRAFEKRVRWLLNGTPAHRQANLDALDDADEINHIVNNAFRFEFRIGEAIAINRIAQASWIGNFFRSTKEAEKNAVARFYDTYNLYANVFEWGLDSKRGRAAVDRMNQIHGRYFIPNDGMKFVLLQGVFTVMDAFDRIGHRALTDLERAGMTASYVRMGQAMHIQELTTDFHEMYGWYRAVCEANSAYEEQKRDTFETIMNASLSGQLPQLRDALFLASRVAMDESYRSCLGYPDPSKDEVRAVRAVFFTVGNLIEQLPYPTYIRTLQNNPARRGFVSPTELGAPDRSAYMPRAFTDRANGGFPEWQVPIRDETDVRPMEFREIHWDEVVQHTTDDSLWLVVDGFVYDLTTMVKVHPGGAKILRAWAGRDASRAFHAAKHSGGTLVFTLNYRIGKVVGEPPARPVKAPSESQPGAK